MVSVVCILHDRVELGETLCLVPSGQIDIFKHVQNPGRCRWVLHGPQALPASYIVCLGASLVSNIHHSALSLTMITVTEGGPEGNSGVVVAHEENPAAFDEKTTGIEESCSLSSDTIINEATKIYVPEETEEFIDPPAEGLSHPAGGKDG